MIKITNKLIFFIFCFSLSLSLVSAVKVKVDDYRDYGVGSILEVEVYSTGYLENFTGFQFDLTWDEKILHCL
ncbi:MAG: hypothetical protein ACTSYJ_10705, partial [Candidatus Thorarchaeota archaeon]